MEKVRNSFYKVLNVLLLLPFFVMAFKQRAFAYAVDYSDEDITGFLAKTKKLIWTAILTLVPAIGIAFFVVGVMKLRKGDEDPRSKGQGFTYIIIGLILGLGPVLYYLFVNYYAGHQVSTPGYEYLNPEQ